MCYIQYWALLLICHQSMVWTSTSCAFIHVELLRCQFLILSETAGCATDRIYVWLCQQLLICIAYAWVVSWSLQRSIFTPCYCCVNRIYFQDQFSRWVVALAKLISVDPAVLWSAVWLLLQWHSAHTMSGQETQDPITLQCSWNPCATFATGS